MKVRVELDEKKILNKYLIFQFSRVRQYSEVVEKYTFPQISSVGVDSFIQSLTLSSTPVLELPKIDTSGC